MLQTDLLCHVIVEIVELLEIQKLVLRVGLVVDLGARILRKIWISEKCKKLILEGVGHVQELEKVKMEVRSITG